MLYALFGSDTKRGSEKVRSLVETLHAKRSNAPLLRLTAETYTPGSLDELVYGQGLFSEKCIVALDRVCENEEAKEAVLERLSDMGRSENVFVLFESALDAKTRKKIERHAKQVQIFDAPEKKSERFNVFSLTDALGRRNKKALWVGFQRALRAGISPEEIHGILFWQVKAMHLSQKTGSAKEAGLNPFVYKKSQAFTRNFSPNELAQLSGMLVTLYHEARRGRYELDTALERFILGV